MEVKWRAVTNILVCSQVIVGDLLTVCLVILRLSVRAFTKLNEDLPALYTDTYLSEPIMTDAGITCGLTLLKADL